MSLFSLRIRCLRKENNDTQEDLAKYLNTLRTTISAYESGRIVPSYDKIQKIAEKYNVTVDYLMGRTNHKDYNINSSNVPDVMEQLSKISDELSSDVTVVMCKGRKLTEKEKKKIVPFISSTMNMIEVFTKESSGKGD